MVKLKPQLGVYQSLAADTLETILKEPMVVNPMGPGPLGKEVWSACDTDIPMLCNDESAAVRPAHKSGDKDKTRVAVHDVYACMLANVQDLSLRCLEKLALLPRQLELNDSPDRVAAQPNAPQPSSPASVNASPRLREGDRDQDRNDRVDAARDHSSLPRPHSAAELARERHHLRDFDDGGVGWLAVLPILCVGLVVALALTHYRKKHRQRPASPRRGEYMPIE